MRKFSKYQVPFKEEDISFLKNPKIFREVVLHLNDNRITIIVDPPDLKNHVSVYFSTKEKVEKYTFDLFQINYHDLLFELLIHNDFGNSKILQLETYNRIQKAISSYYIDEKGCKFLYRERSENSTLYALTVQLDLVTMFTVCLIDEDCLLNSIKNRVSSLVRKDIISASNINYVYLQHNTKNNRYKIGFSKQPKHREKTLQSEEPDIQVYRQWIASQKYEGILKKKFESKHIRGEWYALSKDDLDKIDKIMNKFYNSIESAVLGIVSNITNVLIKGESKKSNKM